MRNVFRWDSITFVLVINRSMSGDEFEVYLIGIPDEMYLSDPDYYVFSLFAAHITPYKFVAST